METQLAYSFDTDQIANRFLNDVRSGTVPGVKAGFFGNNKTIKICCTLLDDDGGFDTRSAQLDDMANLYEGSEVLIG
jgi:hypothetical protein